MIKAICCLLVVFSGVGSLGAEILSPLLLDPPQAVKSAGEDPLRVTVRFKAAVSSADRAALEALGAVVVETAPGRPAVVGPVVSIWLAQERLLALAALEGVERIEPAVPMVLIRPLNQTAAEIGANRRWTPPPGNPAAMGQGVLIADLEGGWDIFHPDFFRPDGGLVDFVDRDGDGRAGAGDGVDLDGDGTFESVLSLLEGVRDDMYTGEMDFKLPGYQPDVDWLYVDDNGNARRDYGAGFDDSVDVGERLIRLRTSKVQALRVDVSGRPVHTYTRGVDLSSYPVSSFDPSHGTGAVGVAAAGWPGLRRYTGIAPEADLLLVNVEDLVSGVAFALQQGADIQFYEFGLPTELQDGSSNIDVAISNAADQGVVTVAAAGNLASADHCMEIQSASIGVHSVALSTDDHDTYSYGVAWVNLSWSGARDRIDLAVLGQSGTRAELDTGSYYDEGIVDGIFVQSWSETSSRGNARVLLQLSPLNGSFLPETTLRLEFDVKENLERIRGILFDDAAGWGKGVSWTQALTNAGSALSPATADQVIGVGAYGGNHDFSDWGWGARGEWRHYSGMGPRIDGLQVVDISAPDDPYAPSSNGDQHGRYGSFGGTSGSLPHVAGSAALLLSVNPEWGYEDVSQALFDGALQDDYTGSVPNEQYGHGKVRPASALLADLPDWGQAPNVELQSALPLVTGRQAELTVQVSDADGQAEQVLVAWDVGYDRVYEEADSLGRSLVFTPMAPGLLPVVVRATDPEGMQSRRLVLLDVIEDCATAGCDEGCCQEDGYCGSCDRDGDGDPDATDCAPDDETVHHGAVEGPRGTASCGDGLDNDCDGLSDEFDDACRCSEDPQCDDGNPCTADHCTVDDGCVNETLPDGAACDAGGLCWGMCVDGQCQDGQDCDGDGDGEGCGCTATGGRGFSGLLLFAGLFLGLRRWD
ncbi:MAG: S8 family serine peptidase [Deltaproteobacteria bacterium]|nr:S8 family serine peptidase [Deltaproteobacteria bacterium]